MISWTRRIAVSAGLAVAAVGIAVPLTLGGSSASAAPSATSGISALASANGTAKALGSKVPAALKADLKAAWNAPDGQRVAALQAVLAKAVAGTYGEAVQTRATKLQTRLAKMDPALLTDIKAAIELPQAQRQAAFATIKAKVTSGGYGAQVQRRAKLLQRLEKRFR